MLHATGSFLKEPVGSNSKEKGIHHVPFEGFTFETTAPA